MWWGKRLFPIPFQVVTPNKKIKRLFSTGIGILTTSNAWRPRTLRSEDPTSLGTCGIGICNPGGADITGRYCVAELRYYCYLIIYLSKWCPLSTFAPLTVTTCSLEVHYLVCREFADAVSSGPNLLLVTKMTNQAYLLAAQPPP